MGKYDREIKHELDSIDAITLNKEMLISTKEFASLKIIYDQIKSCILQEVYIPDMLVFLMEIRDNLNTSVAIEMLNEKIEQLSEKNYDPSDIIIKINSLILCLLNGFDSVYTREQILQSVWDIYKVKNEQYGDIWFKRKATGICLDMGRKVVRISNGNNDIDNLLDLLLYCVFLKVYFLYID